MKSKNNFQKIKNNFFLEVKKNLFFALNLFFAAGLFFSTACKPTRTFVADQKVSQYKINATDEKDTAVDKMIKPFREKMSSQMDEVIGVAAKELSLKSPESTLGNWTCDVMLDQSLKFIGTRADVTYTNSGGLRIKSIGKGNITVGKIYELMPFDNVYVLVQCDSTIMQQFLDYVAAKEGGPIAGVRFEIANQKATNITIGGVKLNSGRNYWLGTSDYLVNGGDGLGFLKPLPRKDKGVFLRDVYIEGVRAATREGKNVGANTDGRIIIRN